MVLEPVYNDHSIESRFLNGNLAEKIAQTGGKTNVIL